MSELDRWFARQAARDQRIVVLEEALLGGRLWHYSWYRLRYFFLTYLVESASHGVLVLLAFKKLAWDNFLLVAVAIALAMLVSQFWWGALEAMRGQVRELHRAGRPNRIPVTIAGWLTFSALPGAAFAVAAVVWTAWHIAAGSLGAAEALAGVLLLRIALDLPVRAYHSGIYAMRRVYKPLAATLAPEALALVVLLALAPWAGVWALVVSTLLSTLLVTALTILYTRRVYHFLGFSPLAHLGRRAMRAALLGARRAFLAGGFAHTVMALDSLVVLALLSGASTDSQSLVVLFLSMPTIRAGAEWARLLYFDFKRLELRLFTNLRRRFERHTLRLAVVLGVVFWVVAAAIATIFYGHGLSDLYAGMLAFFLARSVLARLQIQGFSDGAYGAVLGTGLACVGGLVAVGALGTSEAGRLGAVALVTAVAAAVLARVLHAEREHGAPGTALLTLEWLRRLGEVRMPLRVGSARVVSARGPDRPDARTREDRDRWRLEQIAQRVAHRLGNDGAAAWIGPDRVVWFERRRRITTSWLQRSSGGMIAEVVTRECPDGEHALLEAGQAELLGRSSPFLLTPVVPVDAAAARQTYEELVGGVVYAPDEPVPAELQALPGDELRAIFADAAAFSRDLGLRRARSRFDVSTLCSGGSLQLIFVTDPAGRAGRRARARWRHRVTALNVRASIGGLREKPRRTRVTRPAALRMP